MHPILLELALRFGVEIRNEVHPKGLIFDGKAIHTQVQKWKWDDSAGNSYGDYVPDGVLQSCDHDLLHEVCHFIAAADCQRDLPEFGLGNAGLGPSGPKSAIPNVLDLDGVHLATVQEHTVQLLCVYLGAKHNISPELSEQPGWPATATWTDYCEHKLHEMTWRQEAAVSGALELIHNYNL